MIWEEIDFPLQQELVDRLVNDIPASFHSLLPWMTEEHYMILKKLGARGGRMSAESVDTSILKLLMQSGIIFAGNVNEEPCLVMAQEVIQEVKKINFKAIQPTRLRSSSY